MRKILLLIIFVFGCNANSISNSNINNSSLIKQPPEIKSVQGNFLHNSSINITGQSFGIKSPAPPLIWETHEAGSFSDDWGGSMKHRDMQIGSAAEINRHANSSYYGYDQFDMYSAYRYAESYFNTWYINFWFRLGSEWKYRRETGGDWYAGNIKTTFLWDDEVGHVLSTCGFDAITTEYGGWHCGPGGKGQNFWQYTTMVSQKEIWPNKETWYSEQIVFKASTTYNSGDGIFEAWANGKRYHSDHAADLFGQGGNIFLLHAGWTDAWWNPGYAPPIVSIYYDDVYIDNTIARVIIGDSSNFGNGTHQEIQIPTAWSDTSITITFNCGSFAGGEKVYLFVVDAYGNVSNGYPIIIGTDVPPDTTPPMPPSGVRIEH